MKQNHLQIFRLNIIMLIYTNTNDNTKSKAEHDSWLTLINTKISNNRYINN